MFRKPGIKPKTGVKCRSIYFYRPDKKNAAWRTCEPTSGLNQNQCTPGKANGKYQALGSSHLPCPDGGGLGVPLANDDGHRGLLGLAVCNL
jgi:hypothetical protein